MHGHFGTHHLSLFTVYILSYIYSFHHNTLNTSFPLDIKELDAVIMIYFLFQFSDCRLNKVSAMFINGLSHFTLMALTIDRYIFITKPLHYPAIMTQTRTWTMMIIVLFLSTVAPILGILVFKVTWRVFFKTYILLFQPPPDEVCTWPNIFPIWFIVGVCAIYVCLLCIVVFIYSVILIRYRRLKFKLTALKNVVIDGKKEKTENMPKKSNNVVKNISIIVYNARSASYVLVIVTVYLIVWTPFFAVCTFKTMDSFFNDNEHEPILEMSHVDIKLLKRCLKLVFTDQRGCELNIQNVIHTNMFIRSIQVSEEMKTIFRLFGVYFSLLNSVANPVLYAFWYPVFRTYVCEIVNYCTIKRSFQININ
jgi:hypothetical protein